MEGQAVGKAGQYHVDVRECPGALSRRGGELAAHLLSDPGLARKFHEQPSDYFAYFFQITLVISSPSSSTMGFATSIFLKPW